MGLDHFAPSALYCINTARSLGRWPRLLHLAPLALKPTYTRRDFILLQLQMVNSPGSSEACTCIDLQNRISCSQLFQLHF